VTGLFYVGVVLFFFPRWRIMAGLALIAFLFAKLVVTSTISFIYKRKRPYQKLEYCPPASPIFLTFLHKKFDSMPSGHAASLAAISTVCWTFCPSIGILGFIATFFNGIARVVLGYHHPSDILAGWLLGFATGYLAYAWLLPRLFTI